MRTGIGTTWVMALAALLSACGGGGGGSGTTASGTGTATTPSTTSPAVVAGCSLRARQEWAAAQLREWYLFPETLPASLDPAGYATVDDYIDGLTATARSQSKDRYFTYLTSIKEEDAYYDSGATAGLGVRFAYYADRIVVLEAYEGGPGLAAGLDRGDAIVGIGTSATNTRTVSDLLAGGNSVAPLIDALGPDTAGTTRFFTVRGLNGANRAVTITKAAYTIQPISPRYGVSVIEDSGRKVGYLNLRTFIDTAAPALREAFGRFQREGVTEYVIDLRYNGGGLVSIARLMGNLLGGARSGSDVFGYQSFRPEKSANDQTWLFAPEANSVRPRRITFITTRATASASELVINAMQPYFGSDVAIVGANTYGKPVGQIALDRAACDDRLRVVAFATQNANRSAAYYNGLAGTVRACSATDELTKPLGTQTEASIVRALDLGRTNNCPILSAAAATADVARAQGVREAVDGAALLQPDHPNFIQREMPGTF